MRSGIHPDYVECKVTCSCGSNFVTRATVPEMHLELCSKCHPFYTGQQKFVDTGGRVGRFESKFGDAGAKVIERETVAKEARVAAQSGIEETAREEREERAKKREERRVRAAERAELEEAKAGREETPAEADETPAEDAVEADETPAEDAVEADETPAEDAKEEVSE